MTASVFQQPPLTEKIVEKTSDKEWIFFCFGRQISITLDIIINIHTVPQDTYKKHQEKLKRILAKSFNLFQRFFQLYKIDNVKIQRLLRVSDEVIKSDEKKL